jgi:chloramphenicol 3-O-phosphotransferase
VIGWVLYFSERALNNDLKKEIEWLKRQRARDREYIEATQKALRMVIVEIGEITGRASITEAVQRKVDAMFEKIDKDLQNETDN